MSHVVINMKAYLDISCCSRQVDINRASIATASTVPPSKKHLSCHGDISAPPLIILFPRSFAKIPFSKTFDRFRPAITLRAEYLCALRGEKAGNKTRKRAGRLSYDVILSSIHLPSSSERAHASALCRSPRHPCVLRKRSTATRPRGGRKFRSVGPIKERSTNRSIDISSEGA